MQENKTLNVVAAIILVDSKVLACRRAAHKQASGEWEFPGGKIDKGESAHEALVREIREELGLHCAAVRPFDVSETVVGQHVIRLETMFCELPFTQQLTSTDHDAFAWVSAGESQKLKWATPDLPALNRLIKENFI